jgi:hypothetical protein
MSHNEDVELDEDVERKEGLSWKERKALLETETEWLPIVAIKKFNDLPVETVIAVANQEVDCPICKNKGHVSAEYKGTVTGLTKDEEITCPCGTHQLFWAVIKGLIPRHDRWVKLNKLQPSDKSELAVGRQQEVIQLLQANPRASYAMFGPAGTSKTTFSVALFQQRVWNWVCGLGNVHPLKDEFSARAYYSAQLIAECPIYRVSAKTLLDDFVKESMHEEDERENRIRPIINRAKIQKLGENGALFLSEVDKVHYTEFKTNALFELFDACYENGMQLVFDTNLRLDKFANQFGPETGPAIARRVGEACEILDFFGDK